jgi:hypothetical protein
MSCNVPYRRAYLLAFLGIFLLTACAKIHLNRIPEPPPTAKLRVYVLALTGHGTWNTPQKEFAAKTEQAVERFLEETGIYEVVTKQDVRAVLGEQDVSRWQIASDDWSTARSIGRALHADYVMVIERSIGGAGGGGDFSVDNVLINTETGKKYGSWYILSRVKARDRNKTVKLIRATHRNIFQSAKKDMLATAIKKGKRIAQPKKIAAVTTALPPHPAPAAPQEPAIPQKPIVPQISAPTTAAQKPIPPPVQKKTEQPEPMMAQEPAAPTPMQQEAMQKTSKPEWMKEVRLEEALTLRPDSAKGTKLVVYDLESPENYRPAALILSEALREELFVLKKFVLVNREDLQKVLEEMALQQTGLIDEKQAIKTGKGLAANQVVTGRLGLLDKTYVLQAKRIDVETFATLGLTSMKFKQGQEDEVLSHMKDLAKKLSGL